MKKININREVMKILDNDIVMRKMLGEGLINTLALSRKIQRDRDLKCSLNTIISSIRRYDGKLNYDDYIKNAYEQMYNSKLSTRTKIFSLTLKKRIKTRKIIAEIYSKIEPEETFIFLEASKHMKIIMDKEKEKIVESLFEENEIVGKEGNIGMLKIVYNTDVSRVPGIIALVTNELCSNDISIIGSLYSNSEHIIIVDEKDMKKSFNVIFNISHDYKESE